MENLFSVLLSVYPLTAAVTAVSIGQVYKVLRAWVQDGTFHLELLKSSGGMPSCHSALMTALTLAFGIQDGWSSTGFMICLTISFVILYDAMGVRRAAGEQARILNKLGAQCEGKPLKEKLGHSPVEVLVGIILGIGTALAFLPFL